MLHLPKQFTHPDPRRRGAFFDGLRYISEGSFGKVYKARKSGSIVALKLLIDEDNDEEVHNERHILYKLEQSPMKEFFINLLDSFIYDGKFVMVYEFMTMDLHSYMQNYAYIHTKQARKLLHQLLLALNQLKEYGIIHADLKPSNIMINDDLALKVIDFGASHYTKDVRQHTQICTLPCRAPEVILGAGYNEAMDMWAFGCIAAEMLINRRLYPAREELDMLVMFKQTHGVYPQSLVQSARRYKKYFHLEGRGYIFAPENYKVLDVGTTRSRMAFECEYQNCSSKGRMWRLALSRVVSDCLELDPNIRMKPSDALKSSFFSETQWEEDDIVDIQTNGTVPEKRRTCCAGPRTPCDGPRTPSTVKAPPGVRSRSPVNISPQ